MRFLDLSIRKGVAFIPKIGWHMNSCDRHREGHHTEVDARMTRDIYVEGGELRIAPRGPTKPNRLLACRVSPRNMG